MKKLLAYFLLLVLTSMANAIPNVWKSENNHGGYDIKISNQQGDTLELGCYLGEYPMWHNLTIETKGKKYELRKTDTEHPLSFFINNDSAYTPTLRAKTNTDISAWNTFISVLPTAKKIEVYYRNQHFFTLNPRNGESELQYINDCTIERFND